MSYNVVLEAGGWEVVKKFVELGLGVSIVTSICLTGTERLAAIPLNEYFPQRSYGAVIRRGKFLTPQARRFLEIMDTDFFRRVDLQNAGPTVPPLSRVRDIRGETDFTGHDKSLP